MNNKLTNAEEESWEKRILQFIPDGMPGKNLYKLDLISFVKEVISQDRQKTRESILEAIEDLYVEPSANSIYNRENAGDSHINTHNNALEEVKELILNKYK